MKTKLLIISRLVKLLAIVALVLVHTPCDETETTDSTGFILHYYGVAGIGPSMTYTSEAPTYKGSAPYDSTITGAVLNNEACTTGSFVIDAETGAIDIQNTTNLATGLYVISVGCYFNGKYFEFKDATQINMLLAVPEGVTVTPAGMVVKMEDKNWWEASAQVTTDTEKHVSIAEYAIAEGESKEHLKYFTISDDGIITFNPEKKDNIIPGEKYVISLKLKVKASEHLHADVVTFNVTSKSPRLRYAPNEIRAEKNIVHESQLPTIQGSSEGRTYTTKSITPEIPGFTIGAAIGKISIAENTLTQIGNVYEVDTTVTSKYGASDLPKAYIVTVVDFINPIDPETFKHEVPETYEGKGYTIPLTNEFKGDEVIFGFAEDNSDIIKEQIGKNGISIDKVNGTITIAESSTLTPEDYTVKVKAANPKGEVLSSFTLTIKENPNKFTFYYGNNLDLSPKENYANQFEFSTKEELANFTLVPITTLNGRGAKWEVCSKQVQSGSNGVEVTRGTTVDPKSGVLTFTGEGFTTIIDVGMLVVKATVGTSELAYIVTVPVFIKCGAGKIDINVRYKPFVFQVNPKTGGHSTVPETKLSSNMDIDKFAMDYRKEFNFFGTDSEPKGYLPQAEGSLLNDILTTFYNNIGATKVNLGGKKPLSYYSIEKPIDNERILNQVAGYIDPKDKVVVINPEIWKDKRGKYANGVLLGRVSHITNGDSTDENINKGMQSYPIAIWFDENF